LRSSLSQGSYQVNIVYLTRCGEEAILHAAHAVSASLFLSNGIRYWVTLRILIRLRSGGFCSNYLLEISGRDIRWLRPGERNLLGFLETVLNGKYWPGVRVERLGTPTQLLSISGECLGIEEYARDPGHCPSCITVDEERVHSILKPWWLLAAIMVVNDAKCRGGCSRGS